MNFNHDTGSVESLLSIDTTVASPINGATQSLVVVGSGALYLPIGDNAQRPTNSPGMLRYNTDSSALEYNTGSAWSVLSTGGGTVTSVTVAGSTGLSSSGSPITSSGTITLTLDAGLQSLAQLTDLGVIVQSGADTFVARTITGTASNIAVTNGAGTGGNPTIDLVNAGTPITGSFVKITTDAKGRVTGSSAVATGDITPLVDGTYVNVAGDAMASAANLTFSGGGEVLGLPDVPTTSGSAVSKSYVDGLVQGLDPKASVRAATTVGGGLATAYQGGSVIDGITLIAGDRILVKNQTASEENGIYIVNPTGAPTRAPDMNVWTEVASAFTFVEAGATQADTGWTSTANTTGTIGVTPIVFVQFSGAGTYTAGAGLTLTGTQFSLTTPVVVANGGTGVSTAPTNGQLLIGNGTDYSLQTLTQGTGITVTNGVGTITIANAGVTTLAGTANQITASASTGAVTLSLPSAVTLPGSLTVTTNAIIQGLTANSFLYTSAAKQLTSTAAPVNGQLLIGSTGNAPVAATLTPGTGIQITNGAGSVTISSTVTGTVTSVDVAGGGTGLTFSGGPITTSGTITMAGTLAPVSGGTGLSSLGSANQVLGVNGGATAVEYKTITAGTGMSVVHGAGVITLNNTGVTSVALSAPSIFTVSGSPVTTSGTLTFALATQANNVVFAGPTTGGPLAPTFRQLTFADLSATAIKLYVENPSTPTAPTAAGANAVAIGSGASAPAANSFAAGQGTSASIPGQKAFANGSFATAGDAQHNIFVLRNITTDATLTELFLDGVTATSRIVLPNNSLFTFDILVAGRRTDDVGGGAGYRFLGGARKDTTSGSITFVGTPSKTVIGETNTAWDAAVSVDTTNGSIRVRVTGESAKTIRWVATVQATQVTN